MRSLLPYPALAVCLVLMWLLLTAFTPGQFVLAVLVAVGASHAMNALGEVSPKVHRWLAIPQLLGIVLYDIAISNVTVAKTLLFGRRSRQSGFVTIPLRLRNPSALAVLAIVLTSTPHGSMPLKRSSFRIVACSEAVRCADSPTVLAAPLDALDVVSAAPEVALTSAFFRSSTFLSMLLVSDSVCSDVDCEMVWEIVCAAI